VSLGRKHPTQKALFTYSHNNSTTNPHPQNSNSAVNDDPHKILYIANICDFGTRLAIELAKG
ncbi:MAG: hypothetical protein E6490_09615, partial [Bifidobacterium longum]|nr:hypothetical protein [Bifidobacterium longum]MDU6624107.1 hypothetical protein [Bifidobacterium longum]